MGALVGTDTALEIANIIVDISQLTDNISSENNLFVFLSLNQHLWRAIDDLDIALILLSKDCVKENIILKLIDHSIGKLELTKKKVNCFLKHNFLNEEQAASIHAAIDLMSRFESRPPQPQRSQLQCSLRQSRAG